MHVKDSMGLVQIANIFTLYIASSLQLLYFELLPLFTSTLQLAHFYF